MPNEPQNTFTGGMADSKVLQEEVRHFKAEALKFRRVANDYKALAEELYTEKSNLQQELDKQARAADFNKHMFQGFHDRRIDKLRHQLEAAGGGRGRSHVRDRAQACWATTRA